MEEAVKPPVPDRNPTGGNLRGDVRAVGMDATEAIGDYSPKVQSKPAPRQSASDKVVDLAAFRSKVTIHSGAYFEAKKWKRSRVRKGWLIARIRGYDPVESEYGVSYLKVVGRRPKRTSGDYSLYEHAGFFTWSALQAAGRFVKERKRYERIHSDGAGAS